MLRLRFAALAASLLPALALMSACGEEKVASAPTTFCTDGKAECIGNVVATCTEGGKNYKLAPCGESKFCQDAECKPVVCEKGKKSCSTDKKDVFGCPDDGATEASKQKSCGATETCKSGTCVASTCKDGETTCGWRTLLTCKTGVWSEVACGSGQVCNATDKKCVARTCAPTAIGCKSPSVAQVCSASGDAWQDKGCGVGNGCYDGVCHANLKGAKPVADAGATQDTTASPSDATANSDAPGFLELPKKEVALDQLDKFTVTFSETAKPGAGVQPLKFSNASAFYSSAEKRLQITGDLDLTKVEIQIKDVEDFGAGNFTAAGGEAADTVIYMNDGTTDPGKVQWKYVSADYDITITEWGGPGERIIGKFSAELADQVTMGKKAYLIDGEFDVKRSN